MSTPLDLSTFKTVQSNLFVRIECSYYKANAQALPTTEILRFSDFGSDYTVNGELYTGLGRLMSITTTSSELRNSNAEITIAVSGIPNSSIYEIVNSRIKGSKVTIYRVFFDSGTNTQLARPGNPATRYRGFVNNYSLQEDYDVETRTSSNTLLLACTSAITVFENKIAGRRTSPTSMKQFYPTDLSMDRVPVIESVTFDFGVPK